MKHKIIFCIIFLISCFNSLASITGTLNVCVGSNRTLSDATHPGGTWSSVDPSIATIGSTSGIVTGVLAGTVTISYTGGGGHSVVMTVNASPDAISGTTSICQEETTTLTCSPGGGTWYSNYPSIASVNSSTGDVTGHNANTATIRYQLNAHCSTTVNITVKARPSSFVPNSQAKVCVDASISSSFSDPGGYGPGVFSSSSTTLAIVGASTGIITGVSAGTPRISYSYSNGCYLTHLVTVVALPSVILGPDHVCVGATGTYTSSPSGFWSSSNTSIATIGLTTALLTGISSGTATITNNANMGILSCNRTRTVTVGLPAITGDPTTCVGGTTVLSHSVGGGTWSSTNTSVATVSSSGVVTGVAVGTATISYHLSSGCTATAVVAVNETTINGNTSGSSSVAVGSATTLTGAEAGGTWSSSNTAVATVNSSGVVTGVWLGTAIITYTVESSCIATHTITVTSPAVCEVLPIATCDDIIAYCSGMKLSVSAPPGASVTWSVTPTTGAVTPTPDGSGYYEFVSEPAVQIYTLTATLTVGGSSTSSTIQMVVNGGHCFPCDYFKPNLEGVCSPVPYFKTITASTLNSSNILVGTPYYFIAKDATIDIDPPAGDVFFMGSDVKLDVEGMITLDGVHLFSSPNAFCEWEGIRVVNNNSTVGQLKVTGSTLIENAMDSGAVWSTTTASGGGAFPSTAWPNIIQSDQAIYNRNRLGMRVTGFTASVSGDYYPFNVINSVFTYRDFSGYHDPEVSEESLTCADYYPFKWPTASYLKTVAGGGSETGNNPTFNIDEFDGAPIAGAPLYRAGGLSVSNSGSQNESGYPNSSDPDYNGIVYKWIKVGDDTAEHYNLFDTLKVGAGSISSNVKYYNNVFRHTPRGVAENDGIGQGISLYQAGTYIGVKRCAELAGSAAVNTNNRFYNVNNGVYCDGFYSCVSKQAEFYATLSDNSFPSTGVNNYGFRAKNFGSPNSYGHFVMESNSFKNLFKAINIEIASCESADGYINITNNEIAGLISSGGTEIGDYGIHIVDQSTCSTAHGTLNISSNTISGQVWGISVIGQSSHVSSINAIISDNDVEVHYNDRTDQEQHFGIQCSRMSFLSEVSGNYVHGDGTVSYNSPAPPGLSLPITFLGGYIGYNLNAVNGASATEVYCNRVDDLNIGFRFDRTNNLDWNKNVMQRNYFGMVIQSDEGSPYISGEIGEQGSSCNPSDNIWYDDGSVTWAGWSSVYQTYVVGTTPTNSKLHVRNDVSGTHLYLPQYNGAISQAFHTGVAYTSSGGSPTIVDESAACTGELAAVATVCAPDVPAESEEKQANNSTNGYMEGSAAYMLVPNPSNGVVEVRTIGETNEGLSNVKVMDFTGSLVFEGTFNVNNGVAAIDLSKVARGNYMVIVANSRGEKVAMKLVVE